MKLSSTVRFIVLVSVLLLVILSAIFFYYISPTGEGEKEVVFTVKKGEGVYNISHKLRKVGLIRSSRLFQLVCKIKGATYKLKAGVYKLHNGMNMLEIIDILEKGKIYELKITIPEGYDIYDIAKMLKNKGLISKEEEFLSVVSDKELLKKYGIPGETAEGFLYPDSYYIPYTQHLSLEDLRNLVENMIKNFYTKIPRYKIINMEKITGWNFYKILTLASIIEKEASLEHERPLVSAVFHNRIKKRMYLQADPTVIYMLKRKGLYRGNISASHLKQKDPYNTYTTFGLPPGPICNPSLSSILAAVYPADVDYLYFVSKNDGSHVFSSDLKTHQEMVYKYQILPHRKYTR